MSVILLIRSISMGAPSLSVTSSMPEVSIIGASLTFRTWKVTVVSEDLSPSLALREISTRPFESSSSELTLIV